LQEALALAAPFNITSGTDIIAKTLIAGETGTSGTTTVGNSASILQTGTGRTIYSNALSGSPSFSITNNSGALIRSANADTIQADRSASNWTVNNSGTINSLNSALAGSQAIDFDAVTTGTVSITNNAGGQILAFAAAAVRPGANALIINAGTISATLNPADPAPGSDGIDSQNRSGVNITNTGAISGRHGITGAAVNGPVRFPTSVTNNLGGTIQGLNGSGINIDGSNANQVATLIKHGTITGNGTLGNSDGDGDDVDGIVNITNTGIIRSINAFSTGLPANSEGISVGGGTIVNSGTVEGLVAAGNTNAVGRGISLLGNDITTGPLTGTREAIYGNATVTNQSGGLIRDDSDSGIAVDGPASGFTVTIHNNAGATIRGGATLADLAGTNAAIRTGADNDTVNNAGTINGSSSGKAIAMGAGNDTLNVQGGTASITGNIDGGAGTNTLNLTLGVGNSFSYSGSLSNFSTVDVQSGLVTLSGVSNYTGLTKLSGGSLILDGADRLASASSLELGGGSLKVIGGIPNGQTFSTLIFSDSSIIDLDPTSLTFLDLGAVALGETLSITDYDFGTSPNYAIRFLGNLTADADFLNLVGATTVNGLAAQSDFDGAFTNITPVPEPGAAVFGIALGALALARRRRRA